MHWILFAISYLFQARQGKFEMRSIIIRRGMVSSSPRRALEILPLYCVEDRTFLPSHYFHSVHLKEICAQSVTSENILDPRFVHLVAFLSSRYLQVIATDSITTFSILSNTILSFCKPAAAEIVLHWQPCLEVMSFLLGSSYFCN